MCSLSMVCLLKKSRNLFRFGCNTSLWAIWRSFPLLLFLPAATKECVHCRKPLEGGWSALVLHGPCPLSLCGLLLQTRRWGKAIMLGCGGCPLSKDHCMWCPGRGCSLLVPGTHAERGPRSSWCLACVTGQDRSHRSSKGVGCRKQLGLLFGFSPEGWSLSRYLIGSAAGQRPDLP